MHTLILLAVLHAVVSISPVRVFEPYPDVKCPRGYEVWWPGGKEFDNDKYAECIKPTAKQGTKATKAVKNVSLRPEIAGH